MTGLGINLAFWIVALVGVVCSVAVITAKHPLKSAILLVIVFFDTAAAFLLLDARLIAVLQVLVYAGAIMVFILFVVMLIDLQPHDLGSPAITPNKVVGVLVAVVLAVAGGLVGYGAYETKPLPEGFGNVSQISESLYTNYAFAFEALSLLLLISIVGAVIYANKRTGLVDGKHDRGGAR